MILCVLVGMELALQPHLAGCLTVAPGELVPGIAGVEWIEGAPVGEFSTGRVYVVEFWSTWCAGCVESIEALNGLSMRYSADATFVAVHIWHRPPAPKAAEFLSERRRAGKAVPDFAVADDITGIVAESWMDATQSAGLPTAMIVGRDGRLAWFGDARSVESSLHQVVQGTFDASRHAAELNNRIRAGRLAGESGQAIESGDYALAMLLAMKALDTDPHAAEPWMPSTYGHLLAASRSNDLAGDFVDKLLATQARESADVLAGLAHVILHFEPRELRDLQLASKLAEAAQKLQSAPDARLACMIARIQAELGDRIGAMEQLEAAMPAADPDARELLQNTLESIKADSP